MSGLRVDQTQKGLAGRHRQLSGDHLRDFNLCDRLFALNYERRGRTRGDEINS